MALKADFRSKKPRRRPYPSRRGCRQSLVPVYRSFDIGGVGKQERSSSSRVVQSLVVQSLVVPARGGPMMNALAMGACLKPLA